MTCDGLCLGKVSQVIRYCMVWLRAVGINIYGAMLHPYNGPYKYVFNICMYCNCFLRFILHFSGLILFRTHRCVPCKHNILVYRMIAIISENNNQNRLVH